MEQPVVMVLMRMWVTGKNRLAGFTLIELLVVLAIMATLAATLVFFATPSSLEKEKKKGEEVLNLMHQARLYAMMEGKIYAIDKPLGEQSLQLVVLVSEEAAAAMTGTDDMALNGEVFAGTKPETNDNKKPPKPTYETHKQKAQDLGLISSSFYPQWYEQGEAIVFEEVEVFLTSDQPTLLEIETEAIEENFAELLGEPEVEIRPEILFFPDGRISSEGSFQIANQQGDTVYEFSWDSDGEFSY